MKDEMKIMDNLIENSMKEEISLQCILSSIRVDMEWTIDCRKQVDCNLKMSVSIRSVIILISFNELQRFFFVYQKNGVFLGS